MPVQQMPYTFYLGLHQPSHLEAAGVPAFVSHRRLMHRRTLPRPTAPWMLDSGGFTELSMNGCWSVSPADYAAACQRYQAAMPHLTGAMPQDWMCEPSILARTRLSIREHQQRSVRSYMTLRDLAPTIPWVPVLQGWTLPDYQRCADLFRAEGVDLTAQPVVAVGSMCRRQGTAEAGAILSALAARGYRLHALGYKTSGLQQAREYLASSDSMAWSLRARHGGNLCGSHTHSHCSNCLPWALLWRQRLLDRPHQLSLF